MNEQTIINNALRYVLDILEPVNHYPYHNINHTLDVYARAGYLCDKEFVYLEEKTDVLLAALFHDTGFSVQYNANEKIGAEIAEKYLQGIGWRSDRIERIKRLIMSTVLFAEANDKLEGIMQDADLDNLWRKDCFVKTLLVRKELNLIANANIDKDWWLKFSYNLLRKTRYHTLTAQQERNEMKEQNLKKLEKKLKEIPHIDFPKKA